MFRFIAKTAAIYALTGAALIASATTALAGPDAASYAVAGAETSVPYGWVDFCQRYGNECADEARAPRDIELTAVALKKIARVNAWVNKSIQPVTDEEHWSTVDAWDYPTDGKGDCEDYALLKRRMLIEEGFPSAALLLTVVKEKNGDGHSILTIRTSRGDYVLDNLTDEVKPWTQTPYRFVKRQSQENPNVWVAIAEPTTRLAYAGR
jgi:predicted transglutaminase-like cysteine proteinase